MTTKTIEVDYLARVEGEGAMHVTIADGEVTACELRIFEPPRFFEAFLRGRAYHEAPDITARICGICPIAYQMGAVHAMENIFGLRVTGGLRDLRRLIYCGEWIESHVLHVYMLHAPDFLGYQSAIEMARDHPERVRTGLRMKQIGNRVMEVLGGREVHPINVRVGGFYRLPTRAELESLRADLEWGLDAAEDTVRWVNRFDFPDFEQDYEFVALRHDEEYPFNEGRLVSSAGLDVPIDAFNDVIEERQVPHSTALHARIRERGHYFVGPMARFNLNFDCLSERVKRAAMAVGLDGGCTNPFRSIVVRALEVLQVFEEALNLVDGYVSPGVPHAAYDVQPGTGHGCTEAPRGICYHRYTVDETGLITDAQIVPPTSQNQPTIEDDLRDFVASHVDEDDDRLQWLCEQAIRNYDPCISCSCHFLDLTVERR